MEGFCDLPARDPSRVEHKLQFDLECAPPNIREHRLLFLLPAFPPPHPRRTLLVWAELAPEWKYFRRPMLNSSFSQPKDWHRNASVSGTVIPAPVSVAVHHCP